MKIVLQVKMMHWDCFGLLERGPLKWHPLKRPVAQSFNDDDQVYRSVGL